MISFLFLIVIFTSTSNSLSLNPKRVPCYHLERAGRPFWLHFNWWIEFDLESPWQLLFMPSCVGNVLRSGDRVICGSSSTCRLWGWHRWFVPDDSKKLLNLVFLCKKKKRVHLAPEVIHNPTALINNYFYVLSHKNIVSVNRCDVIQIFKLWHNIYGINNTECDVQNIYNVWSVLRAMFNDLANNLTLCACSSGCI